MGVRLNPPDHSPTQLELIAPYVPPRALRRLVLDARALDVPTPERFPGALLLVDICGFTPLAERLAAHGGEGIELLTLILERYFTALLECVDRQRGEVVSFAGDALIALWPVEGRGKLAWSARDATRCALDMRERLSALTLVPERTLGDLIAPSERFRIRISIGAGEVFVANLGGLGNRWELVTAGEPFRQVARADKLARPGDVVASELVYRLLRDEGEFEPLASGCQRVIELSPAVEDERPTAIALQPWLLPPSALPRGHEGTLLGYIPLPLMNRLEAAHARWLSELRRVTVLFANLGVCDFAALDVLSSLQTLITTLQSQLQHADCGRMRIEADDKGLILIAAFGLPPRTHEDDALRAVLSALAVHARLSERGQIPSIGIATGRIWTGLVGRPSRRDYTLIGDTVNLAARLMQSAHGSILVDLETWKHTQDRILFEVLPTISVKGKSEPVPVFRPLGRRQAVSGVREGSRSRQTLNSLPGLTVGSRASGAGGGTPPHNQDVPLASDGAGIPMMHETDRSDAATTVRRILPPASLVSDLEGAPVRSGAHQVGIAGIRPGTQTPPGRLLTGRNVSKNGVSPSGTPTAEVDVSSLARSAAGTATGGMRHGGQRLVPGASASAEDARRGQREAFSGGHAVLPGGLSGLDQGGLEPEDAVSTPPPRREGWGIPSREISSEIELLGRHKERAALVGDLQLVLKGQSRVVWLEGEPGIGKTRLLLELRELAKVTPALQLVGAGDSISRATPYQAWRPVFSQLYNPGNQQLDSAQSRARLLARLQLEPPWMDMAPLLNTILPLDLPETPLTLQLGPKVRGERTLTFLLHLLKCTARDVSLLIVLDDIQWLDAASRALALAVAREVSPVLLVLSGRPLSPVMPDWSVVLELPHTHTLRLRPLEASEMARLIGKRLSVQAVPQRLLALILERSEGLPLFAEEILEALRHHGCIEISGDSAVFHSDRLKRTDEGMPRSLEGLITSRLDRLTPPQQLVLKVAAVAGRQFPQALLETLYPIAEERRQLPSILLELERAELVERVGPAADGGAVVWRFRQSTVRDVAYRQLLPSHRHELHHEVAQWLERQSDGEKRTHAASLAWHYEQAGALSDAVRYLEQAGELALQSYAARDAAHFFSEALMLEERALRTGQRLSVPPLRRARWLRMMGEAHIQQGQIPSGCAALEQALTLLGRPRPASEHHLFRELMRAAFIQLGHLLLPGRVLGRAAGDVQRLEAARVCERLAETSFFTQEKEWGILNALGSLNLAEETGAKPELARGLANVCVAAGVVAMHTLAQFYLQRARQVAAQADHLSSTGWVMLVTGMYELGSAPVGSALDSFLRSERIFSRLGDVRGQGMALTWASRAALSSGQLRLCLRLNDSLGLLMRSRGEATTGVWALSSRIHAHIRLGQLDQAAQAVAELDPEMLPPGHRIERVFLYGALAMVRIQQGARTEALEAAERVRVVQGRLEPTVTTITALAATASVFAKLWELHQGSEAETNVFRLGLSDVCQALERASRLFPVARASAMLWRGVYLRLDGRPRQAIQRLRRAVTQAARFGTPWEEAVANFELASLLPEAEKAQHLFRAHTLFEWMGSLDAGAVR